MTILGLTIIVILFGLQKVSCQCTFSSSFAGSTWLDNTRGTLVFTDTQISGWTVNVLNQQINSWNCYDNSSSSRLVLKSATQVLYSTISIDVYACLTLTKVTDVSYTYVQQQVQVPDAGYDRLLFSNSASVSLSAICDTSASIPTLEFHVLVKQGNFIAISVGASAAISFPNKLLRTSDYEYKESDGTVACNGTVDRLDMCTDNTQLSVNYSTCPQQIAYTAGGRAWCVAKKSLSGYQCAVVMNQDDTISGTATQFACLCSNGKKISVVSNNCTSNQEPTAYPTAADGVSVIGYLLDITTVFENCAPVSDGDGDTASSSSSNVGLIAGIVVVLIIIIIIIVICVILYKRGKCVPIIGRMKACMKDTPCFCCSRNKVAESEKPMISNGETPHVDTIDETRSSAIPAKRTLKKEKTTMSAISRSSTNAGNREKTDLDKSAPITRQATATSIGLDLKSEKSTVTKVTVKSANETTTNDKDDKKTSMLSFLPCLGKGETPKEEEPAKEEPVETTKEKKKPGTEKAKAKAKGGGKKGGSDKKGAASEKKGKKGKVKEKKTESTDSKETEIGGVEDKNVISPRESLKREDTKRDSIKTEKTPRKQDDTARESIKNGKTPRKQDNIDKEPENNLLTPNGTEKEEKIPKGKKGKKPELTRAPTKMNTDLHLTSTPVPGGEKGKKGVVSVPAALVKPEDKATEWTFLSCCFGNRSPPLDEEHEEDVKEEPKPVSALKKKTPAKSEKKGGGKAGKKPGNKKGGKDAGKKGDVNGNDMVVENITDETPTVERSKTMPERQKTTLSLRDAEKVKVDVYVPDAKANIQLKDTVIIKEKNGEPQLTKAKSDIGLARPASAKSNTSRKSKRSVTKVSKKKGDKSKSGTKSGTKDKKKKKK
ncbi:hypothetical protein ACF0H5_010607 [Mactra antiquata]